MNSVPSASMNGPGGVGRRDGKTQPNDATAPGRTVDGGTEDDPVVEGSADPWAEADAGHPDENASDSLDQHPQPEDEVPPERGA